MKTAMKKVSSRAARKISRMARIQKRLENSSPPKSLLDSDASELHKPRISRKIRPLVAAIVLIFLMPRNPGMSVATCQSQSHSSQLLLQAQWWHQGQIALGRESSACEEGNHVAQTRNK